MWKLILRRGFSISPVSIVSPWHQFLCCSVSIGFGSTPFGICQRGRILLDGLLIFFTSAPVQVVARGSAFPIKPASMKKSSGFLSRYCPGFRSIFSEKLGGKYRRQTQEIEKKLAESIRQRATSRQKSFKSMNSIIMRFPQFKEDLRAIRDIFNQYDEDSNGTIDHEEARKCLSDLHIYLPENEINALYQYCDIDGKEGIQYNEFIVLLCLSYLLMEPAASSATQNISRKLEATFNTLVEAFSFLDKNGDGKFKRKEVISAFNEVFPKEKSPTHLTTKIFKEMDWNKDGKVNFKEFLFSLTKWVGYDTDDEKVD